MISKDVIIDVVEDWASDIERETVIHRDLTDALVPTMSMEEVTVISGTRRSGKTFMLFELVKEHGGTYINFEDDRLHGFSMDDFEKLFDVALEKGGKVLYLDEVQEVPGWEKFVHRAHRRIKVFVTGSNSRLLSSDYSKALVGRTKGFVSRPLTYREFLRFKGSRNERGAFLEYMKVGGFPRIVLTGDTGLAREYLDRIIHRDVMAKNELREPEALEAIARYLLSNVGKEFSYRSLKLVSGLRHDTTVRQYVSFLQGAFLLDVVRRYSGSLKAQETYPKKVYAVDPAFIGLGKRSDPDHGLVLENVLFDHLVRNWDVYFVRNGWEVDFLLCRGTRPVAAVNSAYEVTRDGTLARELRGLSGVKKGYKVPTRLVSVYPVKGLPDDVEGHLAHRYLIGSPDVPL